MSDQARRPRGGFTLIELTMVMSVIAILATITLLVVRRSNQAALQAASSNIVASVTTAFQTSASDGGMRFPDLSYGGDPTSISDTGLFMDKERTRYPSALGDLVAVDRVKVKVRHPQVALESAQEGARSIYFLKVTGRAFQPTIANPLDSGNPVATYTFNHLLFLTERMNQPNRFMDVRIGDGPSWTSYGAASSSPSTWPAFCFYPAATTCNLTTEQRFGFSWVTDAAGEPMNSMEAPSWDRVLQAGCADGGYGNSSGSTYGSDSSLVRKWGGFKTRWKSRPAQTMTVAITPSRRVGPLFLNKADGTGVGAVDRLRKYGLDVPRSYIRGIFAKDGVTPVTSIDLNGDGIVESIKDGGILVDGFGIPIMAGVAELSANLSAMQRTKPVLVISFGPDGLPGSYETMENNLYWLRCRFEKGNGDKYKGYASYTKVGMWTDIATGGLPWMMGAGTSGTDICNFTWEDLRDGTVVR